LTQPPPTHHHHTPTYQRLWHLHLSHKQTNKLPQKYTNNLTHTHTHTHTHTPTNHNNNNTHTHTHTHTPTNTHTHTHTHTQRMTAIPPTQPQQTFTRKACDVTM